MLHACEANKKQKILLFLLLLRFTAIAFFACFALFSPLHSRFISLRFISPLFPLRSIAQLLSIRKRCQNPQKTQQTAIAAAIFIVLIFFIAAATAVNLALLKQKIS